MDCNNIDINIVSNKTGLWLVDMQNTRLKWKSLNNTEVDLKNDSYTRQ